MTNRNDYLNGDIDSARERGYDIVQLKYDGWWTRIVFTKEEVQFYSQTNRLYATMSPNTELVGTVLISEAMRGTQWSEHPDRKGKFFLHDIWQYQNASCQDMKYIDRYKLLRRVEPKLLDNFRVVACYPISEAEAVWQRFVMNEGYEGVVFRRTISPVDDVLMRYKREYTLDGIAVGYEMGIGKHEGRLGSIRFKLLNGTEAMVGGGYTDAEREEIVANWPHYLGRWGEFTANAVFESGNMRHARFVRWREDKA